MSHIICVSLDLIVHDRVCYHTISIGGNKIDGVSVDGIVDGLTYQLVIKRLRLLVHGNILNLGAHGNHQFYIL